MSPVPASRAAWTIMVYLCGDNDLESSAVADLREMKAVGSSDALHLLVQFDRYHKNAPTRRYRLRRESGSLRYDAVGDPLGETNGGDPDVLVRFAEWGIEHYPADHYLLVIWNHGMGWDDTDVYARAQAMGFAVRDRGLRVEQPTLGAQAIDKPRLPQVKPGARQVSAGHLRRVRRQDGRALFQSTLDSAIRAEAIGLDNQSKDFLDNQELRRALIRIHGVVRRVRGGQLDVLALDACLMSMVEVLYQLRGQADYVVASEETEPVEGWPWRRVLQTLVQRPDLAPADFGREIVDRYLASYGPNSGVTLSAIALGPIGDLVDALDQLGGRLLASCRRPSGFIRMVRARHGAWRSSDTPDYVDLGGFCRGLRRLSGDDRGLAAAATAVLDVLKPKAGLILRTGCRDTTVPPTTGITVWLPLCPQGDEILKLYRKLDLARSGAWGHLVQRIGAGSVGLR